MPVLFDCSLHQLWPEILETKSVKCVFFHLKYSAISLETSACRFKIHFNSIYFDILARVLFYIQLM